MRALSLAYLAVVVLIAAATPSSLWAQTPTTTIAKEMVAGLQRASNDVIDIAEAMPAEKYSYRPTPQQMSFAEIQVHLANEGNDELCGKLTGIAVPQRAKVDTTATKEQLVTRLKETFGFCETALAKLDDSKLSSPIQLFGPNPFSQAAAIMITVGDWADHYSQEANYLRLNGVLPPTARPRN